MYVICFVPFPFLEDIVENLLVYIITGHQYDNRDGEEDQYDGNGYAVPDSQSFHGVFPLASSGV
jgi:hypothetical protein